MNDGKISPRLSPTSGLWDYRRYSFEELGALDCLGHMSFREGMRNRDVGFGLLGQPLGAITIGTCDLLLLYPFTQKQIARKCKFWSHYR